MYLYVWVMPLVYPWSPEERVRAFGAKVMGDFEALLQVLGNLLGPRDEQHPQTNRTTSKQKETENEARPVAVGMNLHYCTT